MKLMLEVSAHDDCGGDSQRHHEDAEANAEPAEGAMKADVMHADERGLQDEEAHPA